MGGQTLFVLCEGGGSFLAPLHAVCSSFPSGAARYPWPMEGKTAPPVLWAALVEMP